jgi:hypothetical protein
MICCPQDKKGEATKRAIAGVMFADGLPQPVEAARGPADPGYALHTIFDPSTALGPAEIKLGAVLLVGMAREATELASKEAVRLLIKDATENPGGWRSVGAFTEAATSKAARGGVSIQRVLENDTGEQLVEHTVVSKTGKVVDGPHFRRNYKPRDVDIPEK